MTRKSIYTMGFLVNLAFIVGYVYAAREILPLGKGTLITVMFWFMLVKAIASTISTGCKNIKGLLNNEPIFAPKESETGQALRAYGYGSDEQGKLLVALQPELESEFLKNHARTVARQTERESR